MFLFAREINIGSSTNSVQELCNNIVNGAIYAVSLLLKYSAKHTHLQEIHLKCLDSLPLTIWKNISDSI